MDFKEISAKEIKGNLIELIANEWMLISAGGANGYNMMTASWGFAGEMWGEDCAAAAVRPTRYTYGFMEKEDYFTLSFYGAARNIYKICGSKSGRDIDKAAETGLTPVFSDHSVYFEQAHLVIICKKLYASDLDPAKFTDDSCAKWYNGDHHRMYVGKIVKVLEKS